jgi:hypothetical protein
VYLGFFDKHGCTYWWIKKKIRRIVNNETGTAMNARESENYLAISRSSSASKSVETFWAEIYRGRVIRNVFTMRRILCHKELADARIIHMSK